MIAGDGSPAHQKEEKSICRPVLDKGILPEWNFVVIFCLGSSFSEFLFCILYQSVKGLDPFLPHMVKIRHVLQHRPQSIAPCVFVPLPQRVRS